jgi:hypothetical protein
MGFSVGGKLWVDSVAALLRYGAVLVTTDLPGAIEDILPVDASFERIELHALAGPMTKDNTHRENSLPDRVDFDPFKSIDFASPSGFLQMGYGEKIVDGLARAEAAALVLRAMNQMALNRDTSIPNAASTGYGRHLRSSTRSTTERAGRFAGREFLQTSLV